MDRTDDRIVVTIFLSMLVLSMTTACSVAHTTTNSARVAVEQLLLTEATERSLAHQDLPSLPIPQGTAVSLDVTAVTTWGQQSDRDVLADILRGWLGEQGFLFATAKRMQTSV